MTNDITPSIRIKVFHASYGDSFLVECESKHGKHNILIDAGFVGTYKKEIKDVLKSMNERGEALDNLIVTHFDADHISGALALLKDNGKDPSKGRDASVVEIKEIWHNTLRHILSKEERTEEDLEYSDKLTLEEICNEGFEEEETDDTNSLEDGEIGAEQGSALGAWILKGDYSWNSSVGNEFTPISTFTTSLDGVDIGNGVNLKILSPSKEKLDKLLDKFIDMLEQKGYTEEQITTSELFDDAFEFLNASVSSRYTTGIEISAEGISKEKLEELATEEVFKSHGEDHEPPNGSSIAFILEFMEKKVLFLGDAHPSLITEKLRRYYPNDDVIMFDLIKISHHGSKRNTSPSLLNIVDSEKYIISTNGKKFDHPDIETIARIVCRDIPEDFESRKLYFNYKTEVSESVNKESIKTSLHFEVFYETEIIL